MSWKTLEEIIEGIDESDFHLSLYERAGLTKFVPGIIDHLPSEAITVSEDGTYEHNMNVTYVDRLHETGKIEPLRKWFKYKDPHGTMHLTKEQLSMPEILVEIKMSESWRERNKSAFYIDRASNASYNRIFYLVDHRWVRCEDNRWYHSHSDPDLDLRSKANVGLMVKLDKIATSSILWTDQYELQDHKIGLSWLGRAGPTKNRYPIFYKRIVRKNANPE